MSAWTDYYNSKSRTGGSFTATMASGATIVPEVPVAEPFDPCANPPETNLVVDAVTTMTLAGEIPCYLSPETVAFIDAAVKRGDGFGVSCQTPPTGEEEVIVGSNIVLRPYSGGIILQGCNTYQDRVLLQDEYGADYMDFKDDLYYVEREVTSWQVDYALSLPIAKYASGVYGDSIYFFGGVHDIDGWVGTDRFYRYNTKTRQLTELSNGGITRRTDAYGWVYGDNFYMYGGYEYSLVPSSFIAEFWKYHIPTGTWTALSMPQGIPAPVPTNKLIGGHGYLYIANAMEPNANDWTPLHETWRYNISTNTWQMVYDSSEYQPTTYYNFETFHYHKGIIYYFNEIKLHKILPDQRQTTAGVSLPTLDYNPKMCSYHDYIIFSHGVTDGGGSARLELKWFDTVSRNFGTIGVVGEIPQSAIGFDIYVVNDWLYMVGGIPETGLFEHRIWKIYLREFFTNLPDCVSEPIPLDTILQRTFSACRRGYCDRNENGIPDWYEEFLTDPSKYIY